MRMRRFTPGHRDACKVLMGFMYMQVARGDRATMREILTCTFNLRI